MICDAVREILDGAFDGRDQGQRLSEAERHADVCEACGTYRRELRAYAALMGDLPEVEVPAGLEARLLVAVERNRPRRRSPLVPFGLFGAAALGVAIATGFASGRADDQARVARDAQEHRETIARSIARDRAISATDPISGTPVIALTAYAHR